MALGNVSRGTGGNAVAATTITLSPSDNFASNSLAVLVIAYDNSGTSGADPYSAISDSLGNTWTSRVNTLNDPGAADAGNVLRIFTSQMNAAPLRTDTVITVNFGTFSVTAKAWTLTEVTAAVTSYAGYLATATGATGTSVSPTITSSSITTPRVILGGLSVQYGTEEVITADTDTSSGSWSTQQTAAYGSTTSGISVSSQVKTTNATATQTFNPTLGTSATWAIGWISISETAYTAEKTYPYTGGGYYG